LAIEGLTVECFKLNLHKSVWVGFMRLHCRQGWNWDLSFL
jgi:hypothetical protein